MTELCALALAAFSAFAHCLFDLFSWFMQIWCVAKQTVAKAGENGLPREDSVRVRVRMRARSCMCKEKWTQA